MTLARIGVDDRRAEGEDCRGKSRGSPEELREAERLGPARNLQLFLIPLVNSVFALKEILLGLPRLAHLGVSAGTNVLAVAILVRLIAGLYNSERILDTVWRSRRSGGPLRGPRHHSGRGGDIATGTPPRSR